VRQQRDQVAAVEQCQPRVRYGGVHVYGRLDGGDAVGASVDDQRRRFDLAEAGGAVEPRRGQELGPERVTGLRVPAAQAGQPGNRHADPDPPAAARRARARGDEHEVVHQVGIVHGQRHRDAAAHRDAKHVRARHPQLGERSREVGGHLLDRVGARRLRGPADAPVVHGDDPVPGGEGLDQRLHLGHGQAEAADDHQRIAVAVRFVVQLDVAYQERRHAR